MNNAFVKGETTGDWKLSEADGESWGKYGSLDANQDGAVSFEEFSSGVELPALKWDGKVTRNVVYKRAGSETLLMDIYEPRQPTDGKAPVLYYTHGGGWSGGSKEISGDIQRVFEHLTDRGFVCVSLMYRLVKMWNPKDTVRMRDCVVDCRDGLRFLKKHEHELNIDMTRVVAFGSSAGGHLAQLLTFSGADDFPGDDTLHSHKAEVAAGISWFGPSDFRDTSLFEWSGSNKKFSSDHWARLITKSKTFDYETAEPDVRRMTEELSPIWWLRKDSAPLLHIHGDKDFVIPPQHAEHLKKAAERCDADVTVQMVTGAGHGWWTPGIEPDRSTVIRMTVNFAQTRALR
ncbi:MAG: alpha/beta hydrolase [Kiritimatiellae bacterium]|nr:alpha/beta hydrolase [Kiritimatiellia bacterium]